jgi:hypothetical protein
MHRFCLHATCQCRNEKTAPKRGPGNLGGQRGQALPVPKRFLNLSTRPPASTTRCLPV